MFFTFLNEKSNFLNKFYDNLGTIIVSYEGKGLAWLKYNENEFNTPEAFDNLHKKGYKIVATCPHQNDFTPEELPLDEPVAIVFGTEKTGLSQYALDNADMYVKIPMFGFTESYNISVSAALMMYTLTQRLHNSNIDWHLTEEEKDELRLDWSKKSIRRFWDFEQKFKEMHPEFYK